MQIIKNTRSLIVVLTIAALALLIVAYVPKSSANDWWSQVEQCVKEKETAKRNSDDSHLDPWMYNEWEEECANEIPDTGSQTMVAEDLEFELLLGQHFVRASGRTYTKLQIVSMNDHVKVNDIRVNRGNCRHSHATFHDRSNFPLELRYGQSTTVFLRCGVNNVLEVTLITTAGEITYSFR